MERRPEQIGLRVDDQCAPLSWQRGGGGALETIHAQKPARLACEGLCGVVDQDVQPREALTQRRGKSLHLSDIRGTQRHSGALRGTPGHSKALRGTRSLHLSDVGELEGTHDFKPFTPRPKVRLTGIPLCRVGGEARRRDHVSARSEQLEHDLVPLSRGHLRTLELAMRQSGRRTIAHPMRTRPPVTSATNPPRLADCSLFAWLNSAQVGHRRW